MVAGLIEHVKNYINWFKRCIIRCQASKLEVISTCHMYMSDQGIEQAINKFYTDRNLHKFKFFIQERHF